MKQRSKILLPTELVNGLNISMVDKKKPKLDYRAAFDKGKFFAFSGQAQNVSLRRLVFRYDWDGSSRSFSKPSYTDTHIFSVTRGKLMDNSFANEYLAMRWNGLYRQVLSLVDEWWVMVYDRVHYRGG